MELCSAQTPYKEYKISFYIIFQFYDELYKDNPEMLAKKMDECSKHRGRNNPVRPKTPEGFWNPRWHVPDDTEEFNLRNNAV